MNAFAVKSSWAAPWAAWLVLGCCLFARETNALAQSGRPAPGVPAPVALQDDFRAPKPAAVAPEPTDVEARLEQRMGAVEFIETPLGDVLQFLSDMVDVDFILQDRKDAANETVTLQARAGRLRVRTVLELVLEQADKNQADPADLTWTIRDEMVIIAPRAKSLVVRVYPCRDLLRAHERFGYSNAPGTGAFSGQFSMDSEIPAPNLVELPDEAEAPRRADAQIVLPGEGDDVDIEDFAWNPDVDLVGVVEMIDPTSWESAGGYASIRTFQGRLVVRHSPAHHRQIEQLLDDLRRNAVAFEEGEADAIEREERNGGTPPDREAAPQTVPPPVEAAPRS